VNSSNDCDAAPARPYEERLSQRRRTLFILSSLAMLVFAMAGQLLPSVLSPLAEEFRRDLAQRGLLFGIAFAGFFLSTVASGHLADRLGHRPVLLVGFGALASGLALAGAGRSFLMLQAGVLGIGLSGGLLETSFSAMVSSAFGDRRGEALNLTQVFFNVGAVAGPALAGGLLALGLGWRMPFRVVLVAALAVGASAVALLPRKTPDTRPPKRARVSDPAPWGLIAGLSLALFLYVGGEMTVAQWSANYLREGFGVAPGRA